ncbi:acyl carrier protein [Bryobacter aggregatus]|uniref:acyl carrier protein n=1 Tax=Bryobacter aggregatus TaxID=360054 RepID=UPI0004E23202|nr:phosphopantetheine-binding protein [Bryobacter aggregatus]
MIQNKISEIVATVAKKPVNIASDESLFDSGLLDSFALTDLVTALEAEYKISVPDSDLNPRKFDTIDKIVGYVEAHQ